MSSYSPTTSLLSSLLSSLWSPLQSSSNLALISVSFQCLLSVSSLFLVFFIWSYILVSYLYYLIYYILFILYITNLLLIEI